MTTLPLLAFVVFAAVVTAFQFLLLLPGLNFLAEAIVPFTGWEMAFPYMTAAMLFPIVFFSRRLPQHQALVQIFLQSNCHVLILAIVYGAVTFALSFGREDFDNPWLIVSVWRPIWTVAVPAGWWFVLRRQLALLPKLESDRAFCAASPTGFH
jgi:hypothetical protein